MKGFDNWTACHAETRRVFVASVLDSTFAAYGAPAVRDAYGVETLRVWEEGGMALDAPPKCSIILATNHAGGFGNIYKESNMRTGTVKFFNEAKGFGFIVDDTSKEEFFVHKTGLIDTVREGDKVTFKVEEGRKGPNAVEVKLV